MKKLIHNLTATALLWGVSLSTTLAADPIKPIVLSPPSSVKDKFGSIDLVITNGFNITITVAGVIFMILFLLGGVQYLAGAGNEEQTKKARALLLDSVIGLAIVVVAWAVGIYVLTLLGFNTANGTQLPT